MRFDELYVGDRFTAFGNLWTKTECDQARQHRAEGIALGDSGYGYRADTICSFGRDDEVKFVPPDAAEIARLRSALSRIAESGDDYGHRGLQHIAAEALYVTPNA